MEKSELDKLRIELSVKVKNDLNFIVAAVIVWLLIAYVWTLPASPYNKSVYTFMVGAILLPMGWGVSKVMKISWSIPEK